MRSCLVALLNPHGEEPAQGGRLEPCRPAFVPHPGGHVRSLWRFVSIVVTLPKRGCDARQEPLSPGPYRSFRELSLAGPVGSDIWCPPTFVGNSGIECFNGVRGFALLFFWPYVPSNCVLDNQRCHAPPSAQLRTGGGASSTPRRRCLITGVSGILDRPPSRTMTTERKRA